MNLGTEKILDISYEEAVEKVTEELKKEGFGILTEIDVKATFKNKIDKDFKKYIILGACNPNFAFRALTAESNVGLFLPCNAIVYEREDGKTVVSIVDPITMVSMFDDEEVKKVAEEVAPILKRVSDNL